MMDGTSLPVPPADRVTDRIAANVRALRRRLGLSLESLSAACGVSRSALSLIERGESSPTAVVLDRIAAGLGVPLASLFGEVEHGAPPSPLVRHADQVVWHDPGSGYVRRAITPPGIAAPFEIVEVELPAGARIAFGDGGGGSGRTVHQQVWLSEGTVEIEVGGASYRLEAGDCLAFDLDRPTTFHNPARRAARYAVVVAAGLPRRAA